MARARARSGAWEFIQRLERRLHLTTVLYEDFEGVFPGGNGWSVGDSNAAGVSAYWDDVAEGFGIGSVHSGGGAWKGYCAGFGYTGTTAAPRYRDSMTAYMSKTVNLAGFSTA